MKIIPEDAQSTGTDKYRFHQEGPQVPMFIPVIEATEEPGESMEEND